MSDTDAPGMTSHRPYLLRALYEWIADNGLTPHLLVDAARPGVQVPTHAVKDGKIVLNIAARAVAQLQMGNERITFSARFGGVSHGVSVPVGAVLAIYARENGQGMALPDEDARMDGAGGDEDGAADATEAGRPALSAVPTPDGHDEPDGPEDGGGAGVDRGPRRGGHLRVVK